MHRRPESHLLHYHNYYYYFATKHIVCWYRPTPWNRFFEVCAPPFTARNPTKDRAGDCYARPTTTEPPPGAPAPAADKRLACLFFSRTITALLFWQRFSRVSYSRFGATLEQKKKKGFSVLLAAAAARRTWFFRRTFSDRQCVSHSDIVNTFKGFSSHPQRRRCNCVSRIMI